MPLLKRRVQFWAAGACGHAVVSCLAASWRLQLDMSPELLGKVARGTRKCIFLFWHRHLLSLLGCFKGYPICVPVSQHTDGEYVAQVMERCGLLAVRGSTTRGQINLIRGLLKAIENGRSCGISPDGPRGPCYSVQPGFVLLARRTGLPVFPVGVSVDRAWELNSWDSFVIPQPFSKIGVYCGKQIPAQQLKNRPIDESCDRVKTQLMDATHSAEKLLQE